MAFRKEHKAVNSLPALLVERLTKIFPGGLYHSVTNGFTVRKPTTIRVNTLKATSREIKERFHQRKIRFKIVPWFNDALILEELNFGKLSKTAEFEKGEIYLQSLSSMVPVLILDPHVRERNLDLCSAPGSKTTQMAAMMKNTGEILANEIHPIRLERLRANIRVQGVTNTNIISVRGEDMGGIYASQFDRVLLDAPCSGEGRINLFERESYSHWSMKGIKKYSKLQTKMILGAFDMLKPGGRLVYSTCTLAPEENEAVVNHLLVNRKGAYVENLSIVGLKISNPVSAWEGVVYHPDVANSLRILPSALMEGFYVAAVRKP